MLFLLFDGLTSKVWKQFGWKQMNLASNQHQMLFENTLYFLNMAYFLIETKYSKWKKWRPGLDFIQWEMIGSWTVGVLYQNGARSEYKFAVDCVQFAPLLKHNWHTHVEEGQGHPQEQCIPMVTFLFQSLSLLWTVKIILLIGIFLLSSS